MRTYFIDIDGTLVRWGSATPLPGAVEYIKKLVARGDRIIWTTQRPHGNRDFDNTALLHLLGQIVDAKSSRDVEVIWNCGSPRIIVNDAGAHAIHHEMNAPWIETGNACMEVPE